ncbi:MAG TPA: hypothetical protein VGE88_18940 [Lysobacter sp.]
MNTVIASTVIGVCLVVGGAALVGLAADGDARFPAESLEPEDPRSDAFRNRWYSRHLAAMGEPALAPCATSRMYRFLWLRTFHHPVAVRVVRDASGDRMIAVELDGAGGYAPGKALRRSEVALTSRQADAFERAIEADGFWSLAVPEENGGLDGSEWVIEGATTEYRVLRQRSPKTGPVRAMGERFLALAGWTFEDVY